MDFPCDSGVIRQYRIRVTAQGSSGFDQVYTTSSTLQFVDRLDCCSDYRFSVSAFTIAYGPSSGDMAFRTNPDLSGKRVSNVDTFKSCNYLSAM